MDRRLQAAIDRQTGRVSGFDCTRRRPVELGEAPSLGRNHGTPDDSVGRNRGTPDDSIGRNRGTPDDSIGRNRGTPDDSIGRGHSLFDLFRPPSRYHYDLHPGLRSVLPAVFAGTTSLGHLDGPGRVAAGWALTNPATREDTTAVLQSRAFRSLSRDERSALLGVIARSGPAGAEGAAALAESGQLRGVLRATDASGTTVLQHLSRAAAANPAVAGDLLADLGNPNRIQQGYAPTCTTTSMQYELARETPAEYARLMAGLTVDGSVRMRGGGTLKIDPHAAVAASNHLGDYRTATEAIFQSAAMEYGNGADRFNLALQRSEGADGTYRGLYPAQIRTMVGQLFGAHYVTHEIHNDAEARREFDQLATRQGPNRPVLIDLNEGSYNHNVALESVGANQVTYRDPSTGEAVTMSRAQFIRSVTAVHYAG